MLTETIPALRDLVSSVFGNGFVCHFLPDLMISVSANDASFGFKESRVYLRILKKVDAGKSVRLHSSLYTLLVRRPFPDYQPVVERVARIALENSEVFRGAILNRELERLFIVEVEEVDDHGHVHPAYSPGDSGNDPAAWSAILGFYADFMARVKAGLEDCDLPASERLRCRQEARWRGCAFPEKWTKADVSKLSLSLASIGYRDQAALAEVVAKKLS